MLCFVPLLEWHATKFGATHKICRSRDALQVLFMPFCFKAGLEAVCKLVSDVITDRSCRTKRSELERRCRDLCSCCACFLQAGLLMCDAEAKRLPRIRE